MDTPRVYVNEIILIEGKYNYAIANKPSEITSGIRNAFLFQNLTTLDYESKITNKCLFSSFWHFIICVYLNNKLEPESIIYFDCHNDVDMGLDAYNDFIKDRCSNNCRSEFMEQFIIVREKYDEIEGIAEWVKK